MRGWSRRRVVLRTGVVGAALAGAIVAGVTLGNTSQPRAAATPFAAKLSGGNAAADGAVSRRGPAGPTAITETTLSAVAADTSPALVAGPCPLGYRPDGGLLRPELRLRNPFPSLPSGTSDAVLQRTPAQAPRIPLPAQTFDGAASADNGIHNGGLVAPPDTDGDVGPSHYVQYVNQLITVYSKTGTALYGPCSSFVIWRGFNGDPTCRDNSHGDPVIAYDRGAQKWILAEFAFPTAGGNPIAPYHMCLAVSTSPNPIGTYYRYSYDFVRTGGGGAVFPDYPKLSIWPDGYYMSINQFGPASPYPFLGGGAIAFDRTKMMNGIASAQAIWFQGANAPVGGIPELDGGLLPSDLDSPTNPPAGDANVFLQFVDDNAGYPADKLKVWKFHADFATPTSSTFVNAYDLTPAPFVSTLCNYSPCVPQPAGGGLLDTLSDRLMYRLVYRRFTATTGPTSPPHETWVVDHTVDATGNNQAGIRWYELRNLNGAGSIFQQGTFAGSPQDAKHRWMASTNIDKAGNIALGYTISDATATFPSVFYTGRLVTETLGMMPQGEGTFVTGTGSQTATGGRWGDYSTLDVDPSDDCTFWHTNEYYAATGAFNWRTRIGSFTFPSCLTSTAVAVARFSARWQGPDVRVSWATKSEARILGFNLYRLDGKGRSTRVNARLIPASFSGIARGASYRLVDRGVSRARPATYKLQVVDLNGSRSWYGVGAAPVRG